MTLLQLRSQLAPPSNVSLTVERDGDIVMQESRAVSIRQTPAGGGNGCGTCDSGFISVDVPAE